MTGKTIPVHVWEGCYDKGLKSFIVPDAFAHPAKYSLGLIERIFDYCLERGYLKRGDVVGDAFGGVAIGGLVAAYRGLRWYAVELEPKFVGLCRANIKLHRSKLEYLGFPLPVIMQGDSRKFHEHVQASGIVTSPPYAESIHDGNGIDESKLTGNPAGKNSQAFAEGYGQTPGQIGRLKAGEINGVISSPPFLATRGGASGGSLGKDTALGKRHFQGGLDDRSDGNIEKCGAGNVQAVISSPPYAVIAAGAGGLNTKPAKHAGQQSGRKAESASQDTDQRYGQSDGQISQLKGGSVEAVVSSPPYADGLGHGGKSPACEKLATEKKHAYHVGGAYGETNGQIERLATGKVEAVVSSPPWENNSEGSRKGSKMGGPEKVLKCNRGNGASDAAVLAQAARDEQKTYGDSPGQIGKEKAENYWQAMSVVYQSCHRAIKPGGYIVLVVKDYVKGGKRVPLCDDTCRLLEHVGFQMVERIHAMLVKETRHEDLFNGHTVQTKSRKSFFRRLAEKNGSPKIDFEEVLIARKPLTT